MKAQKFKLWMGCLGNGITVCNSAVQEHGDYKHIAHISNGGDITFYVPEDYIPTAEYLRISDTARKMRKEFMDGFYRLDDIRKYQLMCDSLPWEVLRPVFANKDANLQERINALMNDFTKII